MTVIALQPGIASADPPRIAVLWSELPGYARAGVGALARLQPGRVWCGSLGTPPAGAEGYAGVEAPVFAVEASATVLADALAPFAPQALVVSGWFRPEIRRLAQRLKAQGVVTVCMADTPWLGTLRQTARILAGRRLLRRCFDAMWVPGARALPVARLAGFTGWRLWVNAFSADADLFSRDTEGRLASAEAQRAWPRRFLFVGRLAPEKNLPTLLAAYARYRRQVADPWELLCVGDGPMRGAVEDEPGVRVTGWRDAAGVAEAMAESGCLVLPSILDRWPLVVHEACCAGLPLVISWDVGSGMELVRDRYNGRFVEWHDIGELADALYWMSVHPAPWTLGARSAGLSRQYSPALWAAYLQARATALVAERSRGG